MPEEDEWQIWTHAGKGDCDKIERHESIQGSKLAEHGPNLWLGIGGLLNMSKGQCQSNDEDSMRVALQ